MSGDNHNFILGISWDEAKTNKPALAETKFKFLVGKWLECFLVEGPSLNPANCSLILISRAGNLSAADNFR